MKDLLTIEDGKLIPNVVRDMDTPYGKIVGVDATADLTLQDIRTLNDRIYEVLISGQVETTAQEINMYTRNLMRNGAAIHAFVRAQLGLPVQAPHSLKEDDRGQQEEADAPYIVESLADGSPEPVLGLRGGGERRKTEGPVAATG